MELDIDYKIINDQVFEKKGIVLPADKAICKKKIIELMCKQGLSTEDGPNMEELIYSYLQSNYQEEIHAVLTPIKTETINGQVLQSLARFERYALNRLNHHLKVIKKQGNIDIEKQFKLATRVKELPSIREYLILQFNSFKLLKYRDKWYAPIGVHKTVISKFASFMQQDLSTNKKFALDYMCIGNARQYQEAISKLQRMLQKIFVSDAPIAYELKRPIVDVQEVRKATQRSVILNNSLDEYCELLNEFKFGFGSFELPKFKPITITSANTTETPLLLKEGALGVYKGKYFFPTVIKDGDMLDLEYVKFSSMFQLYEYIFESLELLKARLLDKECQSNVDIVEDTHVARSIGNSTLIKLRDRAGRFIRRKIPLEIIQEDAVALENVPDDRNLDKLVVSTQYCACIVDSKCYVPSKLILKNKSFIVKYTNIKQSEQYTSAMLSLYSSINEALGVNRVNNIEEKLRGKLPDSYIQECKTKGTLFEVAKSIFPNLEL